MKNGRFEDWIIQLADWVFINRKPLTRRNFRMVIGKDYNTSKVISAFLSYLQSKEGKETFRLRLRDLKAGKSVAMA